MGNGRGEVTEPGIANNVVELNGNKVTPPMEPGLLPAGFIKSRTQSCRYTPKWPPGTKTGEPSRYRSYLSDPGRTTN